MVMGASLGTSTATSTNEARQVWVELAEVVGALPSRMTDVETGRMAPAEGMMPRRTSHIGLNTRGSAVKFASCTLGNGRTTLDTVGRAAQGRGALALA